MEELAQAQKRTEERMEELAQAQKELSIAHGRTEIALKTLANAVGGLSDTIGYGLEDVARVVLPGYFLKHHGIKVDKFERRFIGLAKRGSKSIFLCRREKEWEGYNPDWRGKIKGL